jgi:hypothetical protein
MHLKLYVFMLRHTRLMAMLVEFEYNSNTVGLRPDTFAKE